MVGGAAYYAGKRAERGQTREEEQEYRLAELEAQAAAGQPPPAAPAAPAASGGLTNEKLAQLEQLAQLKERGVLTQEEFEAQKRALLGMS